MNKEGLTYRLLSQNPSKQLIEDIITYAKLSSHDDLYALLHQLDNPATLEYLYSIECYVDEIKDALNYVYDSKTLELLFSDVFKKGYGHCHIANHPFHDKQDLYEFFDAPSQLHLVRGDIAGLADKGFYDGNIVVSTSMILPNKTDLYFSFSSAKPVNGGKATIVKSGYASAHWEGFTSLEWYLKNKLPKGENLFTLLGLKSEEYL